HQPRIPIAKVTAGIGHETPAKASKLGPVTVFETRHELARDIVVEHGGAGAPEGRRIGESLRRAGIGTEENLERRAENRAIRGADGTKVGETGPAKGVSGRDW